MKQQVMGSLQYAVNSDTYSAALHDEEIRSQSAVKFREACVDKLTGCSSAHFFKIQLDRAFKRSCANNSSLSLLFFSFDGIESRYDKDTIDYILRRATQCIRRKGISSQDTFGRISNNCFGLIFERVSGEQAEKIGRRLLTLFKDTPLPYYKESLDLTLSIGVARVSGQMSRAEILFNQAHISLLHARQFGGNQITQFHPSRFDLFSPDVDTYPHFAITG